MAEEVKLSIITGTKDRPDGLRLLHTSIAQYTHPVTWELIITDASEDPAREPGHYGIHDKRVSIFPEWPPQGAAKGFNVAAAHATGEFICWLNDDVEVLPGWAENMIYALENDPRANVGMGAFYYWTPQPPKCFKVYQDDGMLYANFGCLPTKLFRNIHGFDENCRKYGMDNSISLRVIDANFGIIDVPGARLLHWKDSNEYASPEEKKQQAMALRYLRNKYIPKRDKLRRTQNRFNPDRRATLMDQVKFYQLSMTMEEAKVWKPPEVPSL